LPPSVWSVWYEADITKLLASGPRVNDRVVAGQSHLSRVLNNGAARVIAPSA
jgi:hypothetical protein